MSYETIWKGQIYTKNGNPCFATKDCKARIFERSDYFGIIPDSLAIREEKILKDRYNIFQELPSIILEYPLYVQQFGIKLLPIGTKVYIYEGFRSEYLYRYLSVVGRNPIILTRKNNELCYFNLDYECREICVSPYKNNYVRVYITSQGYDNLYPEGDDSWEIINPATGEVLNPMEYTNKLSDIDIIA